MKLFLIEVLIIGVLLSFILVVFNYFNVISVSQIIPAFSFLPQEQNNISIAPKISSQASKVDSQPGSIYPIVQAYKPLIKQNNNSNSLYQYISDSYSSQIKGDIRIDMELSADNNSSESGILISNGKSAGDNEYRELHIFRYPAGNNWLFCYRVQNKFTYTFLKNLSKISNFEKFTILIRSNGKNITIMSPSMKPKSIDLSDSFYSAGNVIGAVAEAAPNSSLTIYSLYYEY